jgi:hypothetical protein
MDASPRELGRRGAPRLLHLCAALERIAASEGPSARARLETELGSELADLLLGALAAEHRERPAFAI